jgi:hypothetical protein
MHRRRFESLENRLLLASDLVAAVVSHTNLSITGDGKDDAFLVAGDANPGEVVITGFAGADANSTQINGIQNGTPVLGTPNGSITLTGVTGNIVINLGQGDVTVSVADLTASNNLTIVGGTGADTIDVGAVAATPLPAPLLSTNAVTVGGTLLVISGFGGGFGPPSADTIRLDGVTAHVANIFTASRTTDTVDIEGSNFDNLTVLLGNGSGSLTIGGTTTTRSALLIGVGTGNTYTDAGGNSLANLRHIGLTATPPAVPTPSSIVAPVAQQPQ